ncbi:protein ABHD15 [Brienomyrus brachyistius]|uniref:protein ABHD15 n=1 Tax=Brienomyrus brachyistius TaxID=42636 RepID=UPI0020B2F0FC|nr:protein ABHD15 [Brienomyrus brachyistius]
MLGWFGALCILVLLASLWSASRYLGSGSRFFALMCRLQRSISRRQLQENGPGRCAPDRTTSTVATRNEKETVSLICKPSALANHLLKHCATFCAFPAVPAWSWRASPLLQTVFAACWPGGCAIRFVRDHLQMSDDGLVSLDWAVAGTAHHKRRRTSSNSNSPVLLIIPNSFGKITRSVLKLCEAGLNHGYLPVVFNRRSHNGTPLSTLKLQQFGDPADLREAVRYVRYRQPAGRIYAVSESTGSGLLLSYLGECGSSCYITAAACLSPVFRCQSWFESGSSRFCHWAMLLYQKFCLSRYRTALGELLHTDNLFSSCSLRALEEALFCHQGALAGSAAGHENSWEAYWERNDPLRDVDEVAVPVLCVCSRDDPVRGDTRITLPLELFANNPHFFLLLTGHGGHCGFSTPDEGATPWGHRALLEFFRGTADFFAAEERAKLAVRRRGLTAVGGPKGFRHRSGSTCKRLSAYSRNMQSIFSWQRSYTR